MRTVKVIRGQLRAVRADMKRLGIKRTSCFNGGMDRQAQRFNEQCFALETELKDAQSDEADCRAELAGINSIAHLI